MSVYPTVQGRDTTSRARFRPKESAKRPAKSAPSSAVILIADATQLPVSQTPSSSLSLQSSRSLMIWERVGEVKDELNPMRNAWMSRTCTTEN